MLGATYVPVSSWPTCVINNCMVIPVSIGFTAMTRAPVPVGASVFYNCSAAGKHDNLFRLMSNETFWYKVSFVMDMKFVLVENFST